MKIKVLMKKRCLKTLSCLMLMAATILTGCSDNDDNVSKFVYEFPEVQTPTLAIDQQGTIEFQAAGAWSVYTASSWVKFIENEELVSSMAGTEGKYTIKYVINDNNWGFSDQEATIELAMNGQTVTIATITRTGNTPVLKIYQTDYETYEDNEVSRSVLLQHLCQATALYLHQLYCLSIILLMTLVYSQYYN